MGTLSPNTSTTTDAKARDTCLLELAHVGIHQGHPGLAVPPALEQLLVVAPGHPLAAHAMLEKNPRAMLQSEEPMHCMSKNENYLSSP